jgi:hypothetical protein
MPKVRNLFREMQSPGEPIRPGVGGALSSVDGERYIRVQALQSVPFFYPVWPGLHFHLSTSPCSYECQPEQQGRDRTDLPPQCARKTGCWFRRCRCIHGSAGIPARSHPFQPEGANAHQRGESGPVPIQCVHIRAGKKHLHLPDSRRLQSVVCDLPPSRLRHYFHRAWLPMPLPWINIRHPRQGPGWSGAKGAVMAESQSGSRRTNHRRHIRAGFSGTTPQDLAQCQNRVISFDRIWGLR